MTLAVERETRHLSSTRMALSQLGHSTSALWRTQVVLIFTFAMPLVWLILIGLLAGNDEIDDTGLRVMQFAAPTAIAMGTFFASMPPVAISVAESRESGVLKRLRGTPLPAAAYLFGQIGAAALFALGSLALTLLVSVFFYGVRIRPDTILATIITIVLGILVFTLAGLAIGSLARSAAMAEALSIGSAVGLSFISGLFIVGAGLPAWLDSIASVFPLKPYVALLQDQFNPFLPGSGWDAGPLALIAIWGIVAAIISLWAFRWDKPALHSSGRAKYTSSRTRRVSTWSVVDLAPASESIAPTSVGRVWHQATAAIRVGLRRPGELFFTIAMPVGLFLLLVTIQSSRAPTDNVISATAASMIAWGAGVAAFMNLGEAVSRAEATGVLRRLRGTPVSTLEYLGGRIVAAVVQAIIIYAIVLSVAAVAYRLPILTWGTLVGAGVVALGAVSLAACGLLLAATLPSARAVGAVGLLLLFVLAFFSDVFVVGEPDWMGRIGAAFPLMHLQNGLASALDPTAAEIPWLNLGVLAVWAIGTGGLAIWRMGRSHDR